MSQYLLHDRIFSFILCHSTLTDWNFCLGYVLRSKQKYSHEALEITLLVLIWKDFLSGIFFLLLVGPVTFPSFKVYSCRDSVALSSHLWKKKVKGSSGEGERLSNRHLNFLLQKNTSVLYFKSKIVESYFRNQILMEAYKNLMMLSLNMDPSIWPEK